MWKKLSLVKVTVVIFAFFLSMNTLLIQSAFALKEYGYKEGDEYKYVIELSIIADTAEGKTSTKNSNQILIKIENIAEDTGPYSIKVDTIVVGSSPGVSLPGQYSGYLSGMISELTFEGDTLTSEGGQFSGFGVPTSIFTTTDWDDREEDWGEFVEAYDNQENIKVTDESASGGIFTASGEIEFSDDDSSFDYDDDGDNDGYTGTFSMRSEYAGNGVLVSSAMETEMVFNYRNSLAYAYKISGGARSIIPGGTSTYLFAGIGAVACVVAFFLGVFVSRARRKPETASLSPKPEAVGSHCIHCGAGMSEGAVFCPKCGKKQE